MMRAYETYLISFIKFIIKFVHELRAMILVDVTLSKIISCLIFNLCFFELGA